MEYVFRFQLDNSEEESLYDDKYIEMVRKQLINLLDIVILHSGNKEIKIDGFRFENDEKIFKLY